MPSLLASMCIFNTFMASVFYLRPENPLFHIIVGGIFGAAGFFPRAKTSADEDDDDDDAEEEEEDAGDEEEEDADKEEDSRKDKDESTDWNIWGAEKFIADRETTWQHKQKV